MKVTIKDLQKMPNKILFGVTKYREDSNLDDEITEQLYQEIQRRGLVNNYNQYKQIIDEGEIR